MMMYRFALISGLAVFSAVAFVPKADAQTVDLNFGGVMTGSCTFTGTTAGTLGPTGPTDAWVEAAGGIPGMTTANPAGQTTINCTSGGKLTVSAPVKVSAPTGFVDTVKQAIVYDSVANTYTSSPSPFFDTALWTKPTTPLTIPAATNRVLKIGVVVGVRNTTTGPVPTGTYNYRVTLTATPN